MVTFIANRNSEWCFEPDIKSTKIGEEPINTHLRETLHANVEWRALKKVFLFRSFRHLQHSMFWCPLYAIWWTQKQPGQHWPLSQGDGPHSPVPALPTLWAEQRWDKTQQLGLTVLLTTPGSSQPAPNSPAWKYTYCTPLSTWKHRRNMWKSRITLHCLSRRY